MYLIDYNHTFAFLIPDKFLPDRPRRADLAVSGVHLLGTVLHREVVRFAVVWPLLLGS